MANQQAEPLAANPVPNFMPPTVPLTAPTQRPNEPITTGVDIGLGAGSEAMLPMANGAVAPSQTMRRIAQFDPSGEAELLYRRLADNGN
jgi:hypothetical protein